MPSSNPAMNDKIFIRETRAARGQGQAGGFTPAPGGMPPTVMGPPGYAAPGYGAPTSYGPPLAPEQTMRISGSLTAAGILLLILCVAGVFGWSAVNLVEGPMRFDGTRKVTADVPSWLFVSWIVGFGLALVTIFRPKVARITGPLYAVAEGLLVGAISHIYDVQYKGIVLQAVGLTIGVFVMMLVLYATGTVKVTDRLRRGVIAATGAVMLVYLVSMVMRFFGTTIPMIHEAGPVGILFSVAVVGIASFNLLLDFDFMERGARMGAPRYMEWYAGFGLMVTLVWLYLEILRLLAKLRNR